MKKLFVVDTDKDFTTQVKSLCPVNQVNMQIFSTGMQVVSLIAKEKPYLVLISLDVPDVNDFVMHDLLKKTGDNSIPVVVTYSNRSENHLQQYKKMKFQPKEYCQKPISNDDIHRLLKQHLELDEYEEDDDELTDEDIDRLVMGEYLKPDAKDKDDTKELQADSQNDFDDEVTQAEESEFEIAEILKPEENKTSRADQELRNQLISLEQQNEFLRSENKELAKKLEIQNTNLMEKLKTVEKEKAELQNRLIEEREKSKSSLKNELGNLEQLYLQLKNDNDELKKREGPLNRTVSALAQEKVTLADKTKILEEEKVTLLEKLDNLEANLASQQQEMAEKEHTHLSALENLNKELEKVLDRLHFYKNRVNELSGMLQQALELTKKENPE